MICRYYNLPLCGIEMNKIFLFATFVTNWFFLVPPQLNKKLITNILVTTLICISPTMFLLQNL